MIALDGSKETRTVLQMIQKGLGHLSPTPGHLQIAFWTVESVAEFGLMLAHPVTLERMPPLEGTSALQTEYSILDVVL